MAEAGALVGAGGALVGVGVAGHQTLFRPAVAFQKGYNSLLQSLLDQLGGDSGQVSNNQTALEEALSMLVLGPSGMSVAGTYTEDAGLQRHKRIQQRLAKLPVCVGTRATKESLKEVRDRILAILYIKRLRDLLRPMVGIAAMGPHNAGKSALIAHLTHLDRHRAERCVGER